MNAYRPVFCRNNDLHKQSIIQLYLYMDIDTGIILINEEDN